MTLEELDRLKRGNNLISKITELEQIVKDLDNGVVYLCDSISVQFKVDLQ